jgi:hypothetical protein
MDNLKNLGLIPSRIDGSEIVFSCPKGNEIPKKYSYRNVLPQVLNQGKLSICVPCSLSAYLNWKANLNLSTDDDNSIDLFEIYNSRTNKGSGMTYKDAFRFLRHTGVDSAIGKLKIGTYGKVETEKDLKFALIANGPCFGALPVYNDSCEFWIKKKDEKLDGYHAISIIGYNEDGFIIRNSWGKSFCDEGNTIIKYSDFKLLLEIWTVIE